VLVVDFGGMIHETIRSIPFSRNCDCASPMMCLPSPGAPGLSLVVDDIFLAPLPALCHIRIVEAAATGNVDFFTAMTVALLVAARLDGHISWLWGNLADGARSDVVAAVLRNNGSVLDGAVLQLHAALEGAEEFADGLAAGGYLNVHGLGSFAVDGGVGSAVAREDVLCDVLCFDDSLLAEGVVVEIRVNWVRALGAALGVAGESVHHVELVVAGEARVEGRGGEVDLADEGRHLGCSIGGYVCEGWFWFVSRRGREVVVGCGVLWGRQFECCGGAARYGGGRRADDGRWRWFGLAGLELERILDSESVEDLDQLVKSW
jgi:hypothetical protein